MSVVVEVVVSAIGAAMVPGAVEVGGAVATGTVVWTVDDVVVLVAGAALDDGGAVETTSAPPEAGASPPNPPANWNVAANVAAAKLQPINIVERFTRARSEFAYEREYDEFGDAEKAIPAESSEVRLDPRRRRQHSIEVANQLRKPSADRSQPDGAYRWGGEPTLQAANFVHS